MEAKCFAYREKMEMCRPFFMDNGCEELVYQSQLAEQKEKEEERFIICVACGNTAYPQCKGKCNIFSH